MTCKDCIHSGLCYKENDYANFPDKCGSFVPDRPQGEWIHYLGCGIGKAVCSECGQIGETKKYCGNCGAEMEGSEEE